MGYAPLEAYLWLVIAILFLGFVGALYALWTHKCK
jgi:VIT1/CCC1 family predicted Fe2+/Mn2+ transporter